MPSFQLQGLLAVISLFIIRATGDATVADRSSVCSDEEAPFDPTCSMPNNDTVGSSSLLQTKSVSEEVHLSGGSCKSGLFTANMNGQKVDIQCASNRLKKLSPVVIYCGNPAGGMKKWMKQQTGTKLVGVNLNTNKPQEMLKVYEWWTQSENAAKYGGDNRQIIMAGYSLGGINSHTVMQQLCKKTWKCPIGVMWFNGVTRGESYKKKLITKSNAPEILIIQGLADKLGFVAASKTYRAALKKAKIPFTFLGLSGIGHDNLSKENDKINKEVKKFIAEITTTSTTTSTCRPKGDKCKDSWAVGCCSGTWCDGSRCTCRPTGDNCKASWKVGCCSGNTCKWRGGVQKCVKDQ